MCWALCCTLFRKHYHREVDREKTTLKALTWKGKCLLFLHDRNWIAYLFRWSGIGMRKQNCLVLKNIVWMPFKEHSLLRTSPSPLFTYLTKIYWKPTLHSTLLVWYYLTMIAAKVMTTVTTIRWVLQYVQHCTRCFTYFLIYSSQYVIV